MENKINTVFLVEYSKDLSKKLINNNLQDKQFVTGPEIARFCAVPQVNYFILRNLFQKWVEEREKLRVPFFDYSSSEVKVAIQTYLDTLSHHIKLDKDLFQKLLETAIYDTLELVLSPFKFFKSKVVKVVDGKVIRGGIKNELKYFKYNKVVLEDLMTQMKNFPLDEINSEDFLEILHEIIQKDDTKLIDPQVVVAEFNKIAFVTIEDVIIDYTAEKSRSLIPEVVLEKSIEEQPSEEKVVLLNDKFKNDEVKPLYESLTAQKSDGLYESLNLNERFLFSNELFLGSQEVLKKVSDKLKELKSYDEARVFLIENYAAENDWFEKEEVETQFFSKINSLY
jgi:hypothetical protein